MPNSYVPNKGNTLLIPSGPQSDPDKMHLFVIVTDRCKNHSHLGIPICSIGRLAAYDKTCIIKSGEHEFIRNDSYVNYRFAEVIHFARLTKLVELKTFMPRQNANNDLVSKICAGIELSPFIPRRVRNYYRDGYL